MIRRTIIRTIPAIVAGLLLHPAVAPAHDPHVPPADPGAIRSQSMALQASVFACDGGQKSPMKHHGGDIAFWRDKAVLACSGDDWELSDDGFAILDVSDPRHPTVLGRLSCVGSASDIAIWGDLVFLAVDTNSEAIENGFSPGPARNDGDTCDAPVAGRIPSHDENRFAGVRIISIADPQHPKQIKAIETNPMGTRKRGTHGLSLVPVDDDTLLIYNANHGAPHDLDIVKVPLSRPERARGSCRSSRARQPTAATTSRSSSRGDSPPAPRRL